MVRNYEKDYRNSGPGRRGNHRCKCRGSFRFQRRNPGSGADCRGSSASRRAAAHAGSDSRGGTGLPGAWLPVGGWKLGMVRQSLGLDSWLLGTTRLLGPRRPLGPRISG